MTSKSELKRLKTTMLPVHIQTALYGLRYPGSEPDYKQTCSDVTTVEEYIVELKKKIDRLYRRQNNHHC